MHSPFDPDLLKAWVVLLLYFAALCLLVCGPVVFYLWLVWRGRRQRRGVNEAEQHPDPDSPAI